MGGSAIEFDDLAGPSPQALSGDRRDRTRRLSRPRPLLLGLAAVACAAAGLVALRAAADLALGPGRGATNPGALATQSEWLLGDLDGGPPNLANLDAAEALTRAQLDFGGYRADAWARLAFVALARADAGRAWPALRRSYAVAPFDTQLAPWRIRFAFENWAALPPDLREAAVLEARAFYRAWENHQTLERLAKSVRSPTGRLALALVLRSPRGG